MSVLTGETGAGKSILIDSLCLLCGAKSDRDIIRTGEDYALVEGVFCCLPESLVGMFKDDGIEPDEDGNFIIQRRIGIDGRGSAKICGRAVTVSRLREISMSLAAIHGQQDTQTLSDSAKQLQTLDLWARDSEALTSYKAAYRAYTDLYRRIAKLQSDEDGKKERLDFLDYRIQELQSLGLAKGEEDKLVAEKNRIASYEKIVTNAAEAHEQLSGHGVGIAGRAQSAINSLESIKNVLPEVQDLIDRLYNIRYEAEDITETVGSYLGEDGEDKQKRLDELEERILKINSFKRKHHVATGDELVDVLDALLTERNEICGGDELIADLQKELAKLKISLDSAAKALTAARKTAAEQLIERVKQILCFLDMPSVAFDIDFEGTEPTETGAEEITFLISANKGEEPKPMGKIASGGELSRIMLAIKRALADIENIGTLVFDEIDTGISGGTSDKIGMLLSETAVESGCQVICVTHSAQIASRADTHLRISKSEQDGRTQTSVKVLDFDGRVNEIARILGGVNIGASALSAAAELIKQAGKQ